MKVSVVMPVYNAADTVLQAIESLKVQSYPEIEIIVVDDGSVDGSLELLRQQKGIRLLSTAHRGIVPALNDGLSAARGKYIARMDADDLCHPDRMASQVAFLNTHPEIGLVGCRVGFGGDRELQAGYAAYVDWINSLINPKAIALNRFIESPFAHPSVMFLRELPEQFGAYRDGPFPEDYELWLRWISHGIKMAKVDDALLTWNDPPDRLSRTDPRYDIHAFYKTKAEYLIQWLQDNNPQHPNILVWGAGRVTRKRVDILKEYGLQVTGYIDLKQRKLDCATPVIHHTEIPSPKDAFIVSMIGNRGARSKIRSYLAQRGYVEGLHFICAC